MALYEQLHTHMYVYMLYPSRVVITESDGITKNVGDLK